MLIFPIILIVVAAEYIEDRSLGHREDAVVYHRLSHGFHDGVHCTSEILCLNEVVDVLLLLLLCLLIIGDELKTGLVPLVGLCVIGEEYLLVLSRCDRLDGEIATDEGAGFLEGFDSASVNVRLSNT